MQSDHQSQNKDTLDQEAKTIRVNSASSTTSSHIVTADAVQAEEVPTIPL